MDGCQGAMAFGAAPPLVVARHPWTARSLKKCLWAVWVVLSPNVHLRCFSPHELRLDTDRIKTKIGFEILTSNLKLEFI